MAARAAVHPSSVVAELGPAAAGPDSPARAPAWHSRAARRSRSPSGRSPSSARRGRSRVRDAGPPILDLSPVRDWWDGYYRIGRWPVEDIYFGLAGRFVRRVRLEDPAGFAALRGRGVLYLANHQVGIESILFSLIASALSGILTVTLAKIEHRTTWLGNLIRHAFAWPGAHDPGVITYFDRSNREELPRIIGVLAREIAGGGKSVMIHVEGTRALSCRAPVQKMSGAFLDMAIATGAPVVPVRFAGGLPVEPLTAKLEYPVGMGGQQITIGAAILPAELASLPYKERKERVIDAINGLGPAAVRGDAAPTRPRVRRGRRASGLHARGRAPSTPPSSRPCGGSTPRARRSRCCSPVPGRGASCSPTTRGGAGSPSWRAASTARAAPQSRSRETRSAEPGTRWTKGWRGGEVSSGGAKRGRWRSAATGPRSPHGDGSSADD